MMKTQLDIICIMRRSLEWREEARRALNVGKGSQQKVVKEPLRKWGAAAHRGLAAPYGVMTP